MKRFLLLTAVILAMLASSCSKYKYETVSGDPLKTRIYTLPNGLKVYMSVMKEQPRIQTAIAVRVGGKNDPAETTGLAHYFEHLMFKGTEKFGTSLRSLSSSPSTAPANGPRMIPTGGKRKNPAKTPAVAPMAPERDPPKRRVIHAGRK